MGLMRDFQVRKAILQARAHPKKILIPGPVMDRRARVSEGPKASEVAVQSQRPATVDHLLCGFFLDHDLQVGGHIFVQLHRYREFAHAFEWLVDLNLAAVDIKALLGQRISDVA